VDHNIHPRDRHAPIGGRLLIADDDAFDAIG
jgi:hypothetical protein